ncbi:MAG: TldD/PmbA family protein, partial [bacterium]
HTTFTAEEIHKGRTRLKYRRGEKVISSCLTVVDDGTLPWRLGTVPFDDERVPPVPRRLVEDGVVSGCLHNLKTSALWSEEPTGNGFRGSLASTPVPGPSNLFILQGPDPIDSLLPGSTTIRFSGLMGAHTIDRVSGDFSLGASGYILEGGEVTRPFRNGAVSGNLFDLMARLAAVGDDLTFYGSLGSPSLLFDKVILSGA